MVTPTGLIRKHCGVISVRRLAIGSPYFISSSAPRKLVILKEIRLVVVQIHEIGVAPALADVLIYEN